MAAADGMAAAATRTGNAVTALPLRFSGCAVPHTPSVSSGTVAAVVLAHRRPIGPNQEEEPWQTRSSS